MVSLEMTARIAIVGSREYPRLASSKHTSPVCRPERVSGGARAVDSIAEAAARARGLEVVVFRADWARHGRKAGPLRNAEIVANADRVEGRSGMARAAGRSIRSCRRTALGWQSRSSTARDGWCRPCNGGKPRKGWASLPGLGRGWDRCSDVMMCIRTRGLDRKRRLSIRDRQAHMRATSARMALRRCFGWERISRRLASILAFNSFLRRSAP